MAVLTLLVRALTVIVTLAAEDTSTLDIVVRRIRVLNLAALGREALHVAAAEAAH